MSKINTIVSIGFLVGVVSYMLSACNGSGSVNEDIGAGSTAHKQGEVNINIANPTLETGLYQPIAANQERVLVWQDEFDGEKLDPNVWFFEVGDGTQYGILGWGNDELQWYLPDNAVLSNGILTLSAKRQSVQGYEYTSARINTRDRFAFLYGRIEARIRLPRGQGVWPAFWLLPQSDTYGSWAASGEIDIVEAVNLGAKGGNTIHGTIHYGGVWPSNVFTGNPYDPPNNVTEQFHVYALEWDVTEMRWYVDDVLYATQNTWSTSKADFPAPFDQPFYIILNLAVGGRLPGSPDSTTQLPVAMEVDYVRVYSGKPSE